MTLIFPIASLQDNQGIGSRFSSQRSLGKARLIAITQVLSEAFSALNMLLWILNLQIRLQGQIYLIPVSLSNVFYEMLWEILL